MVEKKTNDIGSATSDETVTNTVDGPITRPLQTTEGMPTEDRLGRPVVVNRPFGSEPVSVGEIEDNTTQGSGNAEGVEVNDSTGEDGSKPKGGKKSSSK